MSKCSGRRGVVLSVSALSMRLRVRVANAFGKVATALGAVAVENPSVAGRARHSTIRAIVGLVWMIGFVALLATTDPKDDACIAAAFAVAPFVGAIALGLSGVKDATSTKKDE